MATKKEDKPVLNLPEDEDAVFEAEAEKLQQMANMQAELAALKKENAELKKNSIYSPSPYGSEGDYERVQRACQQAAEQGKNPWNIKISVKAPRIGKGEDSYWLSVNGRSLQVPANERYYEMALPFAQCLVDEIKNRNAANDYIDSIEVKDPKDNPHKEEKIY